MGSFSTAAGDEARNVERRAAYSALRELSWSSALDSLMN